LTAKSRSRSVQGFAVGDLRQDAPVVGRTRLVGALPSFGD
jgi:hypothetical protein